MTATTDKRDDKTNSKSTAEQKQKQQPLPLQYAPPPNESIAFLIFLLSLCIAVFPRIQEIDEVATVEVISTPLFSDVVTKTALGCIRISLAVVFFSATMYRGLTKGYVMRVKYLARSKLRSLPINLDGIRSQVMFTSWCFNLLTLSLAINGIITLLSQSENQDTKLHNIFFNKWMLRLALIIFETATPISMLVSFVVRYVLWPQEMKKPEGSIGLRRPVAIIQHNLNVIASILEIGVLGSIPIRLNEVAFTLLWGVVYIFFTFFISHRMVESREPQFVYFFMDTTLGANTNCLVMIALLAVLAVFYLVFCFIDDLLLYLDKGLMFNALTVILVASISCRIRDY